MAPLLALFLIGIAGYVRLTAETAFVADVKLRLVQPNIPQAEKFYVDILGFDLMVRYGPTASFISRDGYHHHIGVNTWVGQGAPPPPPPVLPDGIVPSTVPLLAASCWLMNRTSLS